MRLRRSAYIALLLRRDERRWSKANTGAVGGLRFDIGDVQVIH